GDDNAVDSGLLGRGVRRLRDRAHLGEADVVAADRHHVAGIELAFGGEGGEQVGDAARRDRIRIRAAARGDGASGAEHDDSSHERRSLECSAELLLYPTFNTTQTLAATDCCRRWPQSIAACDCWIRSIISRQEPAVRGG